MSATTELSVNMQYMSLNNSLLATAHKCCGQQTSQWLSFLFTLSIFLSHCNSGLICVYEFMRSHITGDKALQADVWQFDQKALQEYLLYCCQSPHGGLIDKPGK